MQQPFARAREVTCGDQRLCNQAGIRQRSVPDRQIETLADQIDHRIGEMQLDGERRVQLGELRQQRTDALNAERRGCAHAQLATRYAGGIGHCFLRAPQTVEVRFHTREQQRGRCRRLHLSSAALEQTHTLLL